MNRILEQDYKESSKEIKLLKKLNSLCLLENSSNDSEDRYSSPSNYYNNNSRSNPYSFVYDQLTNQFDCVICIEYCNHNNKNHLNNNNNKDNKSISPIEYKQQANKFLRYCAKIVHNLNLNIRFGVIGIPSSLVNKTNTNHLGSFEVFLLFKNSQSETVQKEVLHSKLDTSVWPSKGLLRYRLKELCNDWRLTCFDSSAADKFVEYVSWDCTSVFSPQWKCAKPSSNSSTVVRQVTEMDTTGSLTPSPPKAERPSVKRRGYVKEVQVPLEVEWVFDFRTIKSDLLYLFDPCVSISPESSDLSQLLSHHNKRFSSHNTCPPRFLETNCVATFRLDDEQLRLLGKRTSQRLLSSDFILRLPCGFDCLSTAELLSLDCLVLCERPKQDNFVTAHLVVRPIPSSSTSSHTDLLLQKHSLSIASPEGEWLGNYESFLLPDSSEAGLPSKRYRFFDQRNGSLVDHCLLLVDIVSDNNDNEYLHRSVLTDGTFHWPTDIKLTKSCYIRLIVSSGSFQTFSRRLCFVGEVGRGSEGEGEEEVSLFRRQSSPLDRDVPISEHLVNVDVNVVSEFIISSVPYPYEVGTVVSFDIDEGRLKNIGGLLRDLMGRGKSTKICVSLEEKTCQSSDCHLVLDALAVPYLSGKCATVKIRITLDSDEWAEKANLCNYGVKGIHLADLDGTVFETLQFELLPESVHRPPVSFQYFDKWRGIDVANTLYVNVTTITTTSTATTSNTEGHSHETIEVLKGLVTLPPVLGDGVWSYSILSGINEYCSHQCKFVSYNNLRNPDVGVRFELTCFLKPLSISETPDIVIAQSEASNLDCILPKAIEVGSVVEFLLPLGDDDNNNKFNKDFKQSLIDNKTLPLSIELIKEVGTFFCTAVATHKENLFDGQYASVKFQIEVKASEALLHASYGNAKILIGCPNGSVFKSHSFHLLPNFSLAIVPSDSYQFHNKTNQKVINKEVTISLFNNDNDVSHVFKVKGTIFKWPDTIDVGFYKMEISARLYDNFLADQLIYFNKYLIEDTCSINLYQWIPRSEEEASTDYLIDLRLETNKECPSIMVCQEGYAFMLNGSLINNRLFNRIVYDKDIVDLRFAIDDDNELDLYIEGLVLFTASDGLVVKLFLYCDNIKNMNNYGMKTLLIADPHGDVISSHIVEIQPNLLIQLPKSVECRDFQSNHILEKVKFYLKSELSSKIIEFASNELGVVVFSTQEDIEEGIWELVAFVDNYIPYRKTLIKTISKNNNEVTSEVLPIPIRFLKQTTSSENSKKVQKLQPDCVMVFPCHEEMFVDVVLLQFDGKPLRHLGSHRCSNPIPLLDFNDIPKKCSFSFTTFIIPSVLSEEVDNTDLILGAYSDCEVAITKGTKSEKVLKVSDSLVEKSQFEIFPTFIDSGADIVKFKFISSDKFLCNIAITGSFTPTTESTVLNAKEYPLVRKTQSDGTLSVVLSNGKIDISLKTDDGSLLHLIRQKPKRKTYSNPGEGRSHFSINMKDNSLNSVIKIDQTNIPSGSLFVYPASPDVYVDVTLVSDPTIIDPVYLGTFRSNHFINFPSIFDTLSEICEFHCTVFVLPQINHSKISTNDLRNGLYSRKPFAPLYNKSNLDQILFIKDFYITMKHVKKTTTLSSNFIDSGLDIIKIKVSNADQDLSGQPITGIFVSNNNKSEEESKETKISSSLDSNSCLSLVLPEGELSLECVSSTGQSLPIRYWKKSRPLLGSIPNNNNNDNNSSLQMNVFFGGCKKIVSIPDDHPPVKPIIVLMDKSGADKNNNDNDEEKMSAGRSAMKRMLKVAIERKISIALVAFDNNNYYCCPGANPPSNEISLVDETNKAKFRYLKMKDLKDCNNWIDSLVSSSSSSSDHVVVNVGFAIQDALNIFNECEDVYVIVKGTTSPFTTSNNGQIVTTTNQFSRDSHKKEIINWKSFRNLYPKVKFNFISLNKNNDENEIELCNMSAIGNGFYNCTKNN